jgi:hypothetical protein
VVSARIDARRAEKEEEEHADADERVASSDESDGVAIERGWRGDEGRLLL